MLDAVAWSPACEGLKRIHYKLDDHVVRVPVSATAAFQIQVEAVQEAVEGLVPGGCSLESIRRCMAQLRPLSLGALKSCLQKIIRFHATVVKDAGELIPAPVAAATAAALLFANRGGFSPELQLFTRGATAAFKRLAVILLEDAWVKEEAMPRCLVALLALGLVTQRVSDYEPPRAVVVASMRLAAQAAASSSVIAWRGGKAQDQMNVTQQHSALFQDAAKLLRLLRSFPGDMAMFDTVAAASKAGKLPLQHAAGACFKKLCSSFLALISLLILQSPRIMGFNLSHKSKNRIMFTKPPNQAQAARRPEVMPLCHLVDQHTFRGIAHVLGKGSESSFALRFKSLFDKCSWTPKLCGKFWPLAFWARFWRF